MQLTMTATNPAAAFIGSLFASKGNATPSPAVAYVSLRQLQGKPERRTSRSDDHGPAEELTSSGASEPSTDETTNWCGPDRRHHTPKEGLAYGQRPDEMPSVTNPSQGGSRLSALIVRHKAIPPSPPASSLQAQTPPSEATVRIDVGKHLVASRAREQSKTPSQPARPQPKRIKRKKLTVRLNRKHFEHVKEIANRGDLTYQCIVEASVIAYLKDQT